MNSWFGKEYKLSNSSKECGKVRANCAIPRERERERESKKKKIELKQVLIVPKGAQDVGEYEHIIRCVLKFSV